MTIDKKLDDNSFRNFSEEPSLRVIYVSDAKQIIHEALKKQREICAENLKQMCSPNNIGNERLIDIVLNAPEPEL